MIFGGKLIVYWGTLKPHQRRQTGSQKPRVAPMAKDGKFFATTKKGA